MIVSDTCTEFTSNAILARHEEHGIEWHYIAPAKPMQNGFVESFNDGCAMSASTSTCSPTSTKPASSSKNGGSTTTPPDRTRASTGSHRPSSQPAPTGAEPEQTLLINEGKQGSRSA